MPKKKFTLSAGTCNITAMTAPSYIENNKIYFVNDNHKKASIVEFDQDKQTCTNLYSTKGIGKLIGGDGHLFWTDYDTSRMTDVDWKIKSLNLQTKKVENVASGGSYAETPVPPITTGKNSVQWIEYTWMEKEKLILSKLKNYNIQSKKTTTITEGKLNENNERNGEYLIGQHQLDANHFMLYKSIFQNGKKDFILSENQQGKEGQPVAKRDGIYGFTMNDKYIVYTGDKFLEVIDKANSKNRLSYHTQEEKTLSTPIFVDRDTLIFGSGSSDVYMADLSKGITYSISGSEISTSTPIYHNGSLSYSVYKSDGDAISLDFYVVQIK